MFLYRMDLEILMPAWLQAICDILLFFLPGGSEVRQGVVVVEDLAPVAAEVQAWILSSEGQKVLGDLEKLAGSFGSKFKAAEVTSGATQSWPVQQGVRGGSRGGLMPPGV
jgi:hypothetical protein